MGALIKRDTAITDEVLNAIAHIPTRSLPSVVEGGFFEKLATALFLRIAVWLARKSFDEGGCPIGAVIVDNETRRIVGKGHNTLVQENDPYNHGETSAIRDAGRENFSRRPSTPRLARATYARRCSTCASSTGSSSAT